MAQVPCSQVPQILFYLLMSSLCPVSNIPAMLGLAGCHALQFLIPHSTLCYLATILTIDFVILIFKEAWVRSSSFAFQPSLPGA